MKKIIGTVILVLILVWIVPWNRVNWGRITWQLPEVVTVNGEARSQEKNQLANYSAGVMAQNMDKNKAISEVNTKMDDLVKSVKDFGIIAADIKTQSLSYYQEPKGGQYPGQWQVNNTIEIILRDINKASDLADLLAKSGANNVYGPNFMMDDTNEAEKALYDKAIKDAREKAETIARASGRSLGKILSVSDGVSNSVYPMYARDGAGGGGMQTEPGSSTVYKNLTVTFELK